MHVTIAEFFDRYTDPAMPYLPLQPGELPQSSEFPGPESHHVSASQLPRKLLERGVLGRLACALRKQVVALPHLGWRGRSRGFF